VWLYVGRTPFISTEFEDVMVGTVNKDRSSSAKAKRNTAVKEIYVRC
jgi:hypothetical protein